jgi:serine/threonine protein kinase
MITFACGSCRKQFQVDEELAGTDVRCPACNRVTEVPNRIEAALPSTEPLRTELSAAASRTEPTRAVQRPPASQHPTLSPSSAVEATRSRNARDAPPPFADAALTDFLAPAEAADELGRLGGFRILQVLGHGGMGVVFLGEDLKLGRKVAIKAMLPHLAGSRSSQERFLREARAAAALEHDHIVAIHHVGEDRGAPFIVMPFLKGEPLDGRLQRDGKLAVPEVLRIGREIAKGLAAAHAEGLIHRDIKPANVWLEAPEDRVKILDFGLARPSTGQQHLTQSGAIIGTPAYMAPEQCRSETVDARCDLWSLGVVLYRMCTGQLPFQGSDTISTLLAVVTHQPPPPAQLNAAVPPALSHLVMRLLEKDPAQRLARAEEVVAVLRSLDPSPSASQPLQIVPAKQGATVGSSTKKGQGLPRRAAPGWKNRKVLLLALGGAVVVLLASIVTFRLMTPGVVPTEGGAKPADVVGQVETELGEDEPPPKLTNKPFANKLGMIFTLVPKGKAWLGGGGGKVGDKEVEIRQDFYLGIREVTQEEWQVVMGRTHNSYFSPTGKGYQKMNKLQFPHTRRFPVDSVPWDLCQEFLRRLNERSRENGWVYRLPTVVEWEYACRGGPLTNKADYGFDFYFDQPTNQPRTEDMNIKSSLNRTRFVGTYKPNGLGLYNMHGNVAEWCDDLLVDGQGNIQRSYKGGSWSQEAEFCRAAYRGITAPNTRSSDLGFRVARVPR